LRVTVTGPIEHAHGFAVAQHMDLPAGLGIDPPRRLLNPHPWSRPERAGLGVGLPAGGPAEGIVTSFNLRPLADPILVLGPVLSPGLLDLVGKSFALKLRRLALKPGLEVTNSLIAL